MTQPARKALFVCYGGGHVAMLIPIIRHLQTLGDWDCRVLGMTTAGHRLAAEGIERIGFADLQRRFGDDRSREHGERLAGSVAHPLVSRDESVAYLGMCYAELEDRLGTAEAAETYARRGRSAFLPVETLKHWIADEQPDVLLATSSPRSERAALTAARHLGVPSVAVIDFHRPPAPWFWEEGVADRLCVLNNEIARFFVNQGREPADVVVTGNPAFDTLADPSLLERAQALADDRRWAENELRILWASQVEPEAHPVTAEPGDPTLPKRIEEALLEMLPRHLAWRLIIRPHPSEQRSAPSLPDRCEWSTQDDPLHVLIHAVDAVVTTTSTVGLEGALAGKPVVTVDLSVLTPELPMSRMNISRGVTDWAMLERALVEIASSSHPVKPDLPATGGATARCVDAIHELLGKWCFSHPAN